ncbi:MAG: cysteine--tRNA ligase [Micrococcales bacterium]
MTLSLFDSHSQTLREFRPLVDGQVGIYLCGPTVQSSPHVGHLRSALVYDQLRRWLTAKGFQVTLVRNVTDIDDKVLQNAAGTTEQWWALAYRFELEFNRAYSALGILPPTYEPRATGSIPEMLALIERLIANGYAYQATDGSADVYFAASKWESYGELTNQRPQDMAPDTDADLRGKRDPRDFALWKAAKTDEPASASWQTPWGPGRPGWHIECSAMSTKYLGSQFDIHGGGLDLRFPHHENELAQSRAAGDKFASYWLHNGLVNVEGNKMSKSLGNSIFAADLLAAGRPGVVRYYLGSAHYRSVLDYHDGVLAEAESALGRIESFLARATKTLGQIAVGEGLLQKLPAAFIDAMDADLNIPAALGVLHETVRSGNAALDSGSDASGLASSVAAMVHVLGLDAVGAGQTANDAQTQALDALIQSLIQQRNEARANKDFARADAIRNQLLAAGFTLNDGADSTHWSING